MRYSSGTCLLGGVTLDEYGMSEVEVASSLVPDHPNVWSDGILVLDRITGVSSSGAGIFAHQSENSWSGRRWSHVDRVRPEDEVQSCKGFCSFPGPLQSVQRAVDVEGHFGFAVFHLLFIWRVDNLGVSFVMLGVFLMVVVVLFHLSLSRMVIFSC